MSRTLLYHLLKHIHDMSRPLGMCRLQLGILDRCTRDMANLVGSLFAFGWGLVGHQGRLGPVS